MRGRIKISPAMAVALLALFVSLGGGAYAATKLKKNSVTTKSIKNGAVTTKKIANGAVTTSKLANGAVTSAQLGTGAVTTANIADGAVTSAKLDPSLVTHAFIATQPSGEVGPLPLISGSPETVVTLNLPTGGNFVVTGQAELINTDIGGPTSHFADCELSNNSTDLGDGADSYDAGGLSPSGSVAITGISSGGGAVTLACKSNDATHSFAFRGQIVAQRVSAVG